MVVVERWLDDAESRRREEAARAQAVIDARREHLQAEDARHFQAARFMREHDFARGALAGWNEREGQDVATFYFRRKEPRASADLRWGSLRGPITVRLYDANGKQEPEVAHELSEEGMASALELVRRAFE